VAADDFTLTPDYPVVRNIEYKTLVTTFESGFEQRRAKRANPIRKWTLEFTNRTITEFETVQTLFATVKGQATSFLWTDPDDSVQYTVRFGTDAIERTKESYGLINFRVELVQVL
jgi:phage-related protein